MEQEQNKSPIEAFDPLGMSNVFVEGCPFLGLNEDPLTSLAYPSGANRCHRLEISVNVDLAHQSGFCLSDNYAKCDVYQQTEILPDVEEHGWNGAGLASLGLVLPWLQGNFSSMKQSLPPLEQGLPTVKLSLSRFEQKLLALKQRWLPQDFSAMRQSLPSLEQRLPAAKQRLSSLEQKLPAFRQYVPSSESLLPALKQKWLALKESVPAAGTVFARLKKNVPSWPDSLPSSTITIGSFELGAASLNRRNLGLVAMPIMLLMILLAAIVWWPPPGESTQAVTVLGAAMSEETASSLEMPSEAASSVGQDWLQAEPSTALFDEPAALDANPLDNEAGEPPAQVTSRENSTAALETAVADADISIEDEADSVEDDEPASAAEPVAPEQLEQIEMQSMDAVEADLRASSGSAISAAAPPSALSEPLPVVAIVAIGPQATASIVSPTVSEPPPPLVLLRTPVNGGEMLDLVSDRQSVSVLGRSSSSDWILVRLASGVEGWVNAVESGAAVIVSNLPAVDDGSTDPPENVLPFPITAPAAASESPAIESNSVPGAATAVVNTGALNMRSGPGLDFETIGVVYNRQEVSLIEQPADTVWVRVRLSDGQEGWLNSNYLILSG